MREVCKSWEPWSWAAQWLHIRSYNDNSEPSLNLILLQLHEKLAKNSNINHSTVVWHLKQTAKVKKLQVMGASWAVRKFFLNCHFEVLSSLILCNSNKLFPKWIVACDESGLYTITGSVVGQKLQSTSQSRTCTKKVTGWLSAASLIHYNFLNPWWHHSIWEARSADR